MDTIVTSSSSLINGNSALAVSLAAAPDSQDCTGSNVVDDGIEEGAGFVIIAEPLLML